MTILTIRLPEDTALRLKQLAATRGISLNKLIEELGTSALAFHDAETRFRLMANAGDRQAAVEGRGADWRATTDDDERYVYAIAL